MLPDDGRAGRLNTSARGKKTLGPIIGCLEKMNQATFRFRMSAVSLDCLICGVSRREVPARMEIPA